MFPAILTILSLISVKLLATMGTSVIKEMWNMTERQKMISGQLYKSGVKELANDRMLCKEQCYDFNALRPSQTEQQSAMIKKIFGKVGANCFITAPFWCD